MVGDRLIVIFKGPGANIEHTLERDFEVSHTFIPVCFSKFIIVLIPHELSGNLTICELSTGAENSELVFSHNFSLSPPEARTLFNHFNELRLSGL